MFWTSAILLRKQHHVQDCSRVQRFEKRKISGIEPFDRSRPRVDEREFEHGDATLEVARKAVAVWHGEDGQHWHELCTTCTTLQHHACEKGCIVQARYSIASLDQRFDWVNASAHLLMKSTPESNTPKWGVLSSKSSAIWCFHHDKLTMQDARCQSSALRRQAQSVCAARMWVSRRRSSQECAFCSHSRVQCCQCQYQDELDTASTSSKSALL